MKHFILLLLILITTCAANAQNTNGSAASIRKQMATIRQSTNRDDPAAARKANEQIRELSKKLIMAGKPPETPGCNYSSHREIWPFQGTSEEKVLSQKQTITRVDPLTKEKTTISFDFNLKRE
jgi:hypothetical protein